MHQHLFLKSLWEWFWHAQGMLVWAEANQGLLSIAALGSALILALIEQRRAIVAEQFARDADAAADRRALEASRDADRRAAEASADADRKAAAAAAEADRKAVKAIAEADRKAAAAASTYADNAVRQYVDVVTALVLPFLNAASMSRNEAAEKGKRFEPGREFNISPWWEDIPDTVEALQAIMPAAPRSPVLILTTQRIIRALNVAFSRSGCSTASAHMQTIDTAVRGLFDMLGVLNDQRPANQLAKGLSVRARKRADAQKP